MQQQFDFIDAKRASFRQWAKQHRLLGIICHIIIIFLIWPLLVAYLTTRLLTRKLGFNAATKVITASLVGFSLLFNVGWVYGITNPAPAAPQTTPAAAVQKPASAPAPAATPAAAKATPAKQPAESKDQVYAVVQIVDGDTIKVSIDGKTESVRLIGVDTPETVDPRQPVQCFGREAADFTKAKLTGASVRLESDASQGDRDKYSRLLRYVVTQDGVNFNRQLLAEGYAYEYTYRTPYKYQADFKAAQKSATAANKGLWAATSCSGQKIKPQPAATPAIKPTPVTAKPAPSPAPNPAPSPAPTGNCDPNYTPCVPLSATDLNCPAIGFMVRVIGHDVHHFDGDNDGYGCESYR